MNAINGFCENYGNRHNSDAYSAFLKLRSPGFHQISPRSGCMGVDFCLFAWGGSDKKIDKERRMGGANKQKETLGISVS